MSNTLSKLINNLGKDQKHQDPNLKSYLEELKKSPPEDLHAWSSKILKYGGLILASGSADSQIQLLELGWEPTFTSLIKSSNITEKWFDLELQLIRILKYTPGLLFKRRAQELGNKTLFTYKQGRQWRSTSWSAIRNTVDHLAAGLIDLMGSTSPRIAILSENRFEVACTDLACLSYGFVNVPIQPAAPPAQIEYILKHAEIEGIFVSDSQHLKTIESILPNLPDIKRIITFNDVASTNPRVNSYKRLIEEAGAGGAMDWLEGIRLSVSLDNIASIMYTSGTTGYPKGIVFTYENIISKRFARSLALNLGQDDQFLCFLPLFHTFGRFLEMWGSIFWGSEYIFSSGKGIHSLLKDLHDIQPSVLISIPKRWQEIYETISVKVDLMSDDIAAIHKTVEEVTGGNLRWGLSAAGYLPPEIFRFFQDHGLHLHSGYGMTEATGGITMTPTDGYIENSVGIPLPGMKIKLAEDGELWIKGAYVSSNYWKPIDPDNRPQGWFTTGDIFQTLQNGQIEIIDRKKEIYKNAKGQTIAPQKIENMFRDFDSIQQLFIVGDHMPYNTALVRLNLKHKIIRDIKHNTQELHDYVGKVIHSVNSFLAPFERIVNFSLVERDFNRDKGELTEKGTFKRSAILKHFESDVEALYERSYKSFYMGDLEIQIPNWVFLQRGWTQNDLQVKKHLLKHRNGKFALTIHQQKHEIQIGSFYYQFQGEVLKFEDLIRQPAYCIGNQELEDFLQYSTLRIKPLSQAPQWLPGTWTDIEITPAEATAMETDIQTAFDNSDYSLDALKPIIRFIYSQKMNSNSIAYRLLARIYSKANESTRHLIRYTFLRLIRSDDILQSQFAVEQVVALYPASELEGLVYYALERKLLFPIEDKMPSWANINIHKVSLTVDFFLWLSNEEIESQTPSIILQNILGILNSVSKQFPKYYARIRSALISIAVKLEDKHPLKILILQVYDSVTINFSRAMANMESATMSLYDDERTSWEDVLVFDKPVAHVHRNRIASAFRNSSFLNEALYLFFEGKQLSLSEIPPQGIWITLLGEAHGKTVYRATVQGPDRSYKFAINLNDDLKADQLRDELFWIMACSRDSRLDQLVETVGSYDKKQDLWSEEFIPGLTVKQYMKQAVWAGASDELPAPEYVWPHFVWTGIFTYTKFWKQTHYKKMIKTPSSGKIIIPIHDYHVGGRLVSISGIQNAGNELEFLENLESEFVRKTESDFHDFKLKVGSNIIYQAIREALGQVDGTAFFDTILEYPETPPERLKDLKSFLKSAKQDGFQANSVHFASRRYHRWLSLNNEATLKAKAHFLKDLYRDYKIQDCEPEYPDARVQLFALTVFSEVSQVLQTYLSTLAENLRDSILDGKSLQSKISQYISENESSEYDAFFLKRLAFPELPPSEDIELIATRSTTLDDVEIMISRHDRKGGTYRIRRAMHPMEIIQLQQLFIKAHMEVGFTHEHHFLVALNSKGRVIGGLFYLDRSEGLVYMDKVVVSENYRGTGISRGLLDEFINRMRNEKKKMINTGFLHPGFFYKFGFIIEKDQGGLIKYL